MIADRNKSTLTRQLTKAVTLRMDERGFKPIETEVYAGQGWVADLAAAIVPTQTELVKLKLVGRSPRWLSPQHVDWAAQVRALKRSILTCVVEVKATRSDFRADLKWRKTPPANLAYLAVPGGLLKPEEWPEGWGMLEFCASSGGLRCVKAPMLRSVEVETQRDLLHEIALRRDHRTRYALLREAQKRERLDEGTAMTCVRIDKLVDAVALLVRGRDRFGIAVTSVEDALRRLNLKLPERSRERLAEVLEVCAAREEAQ